MHVDVKNLHYIVPVTNVVNFNIMIFILMTTLLDLCKIILHISTCICILVAFVTILKAQKPVTLTDLFLRKLPQASRTPSHGYTTA